MSKPGFTIIEMAVALAITLVLVGMAMSRYNYLSGVQFFEQQAQELTTCLRTAQQLAQYPNHANLRYAAATITLDSSENHYVTGCAVTGYATKVARSLSTQFPDLTVSIDPSAVGQNLEALSPASTSYSGWEGITITGWNYTFNSVQTAGSALEQSFSIYFGTLEGGRVVKLAADPQLSVPDASLASPNGLGLNFSLLDQGDTQFSLLLDLNFLGQPIQLKQLQ